MKKKWTFALSFAAMLCLGSVSVSAQNKIEIPNLPSELTPMVENLASQIKSNSPEAADAFSSFLKKNGKKEEVLLAIGNYFLSKGMLPQANECADKLYKDAPKYVAGLIFAGDVKFAMKDYGVAGQRYDEAIYHDSNLNVAYMKKAQVYKFVNPEIAKETLLELKSKDPSFAEADRDLASVYYHLNDVANAISSYESYFKVVPQAELASLKEYAILLFLNKDYAKSLETVDKILIKDPKDISLNRMKFYDLIELERFDEAKDASTKLFGQYVDSLYNFSDYMYKGRLLKKEKDYAGAIADFNKAINLNPSMLALYKEISDTYERVSEYDKAIDAFKTFLEKIGDKRELTDYFTYGKIFYSAASADSIDAEKKKAYIQEGDSAFAEVANKSESYLGSLWRARINALMDPENPNDISKNFYEETIKRLDGKDNATSMKECLKYLAFYYMKKDDNEKAKEYSNKVLAIDPNDAMAKQILQVLK